ncbi:hypothetical protein [Pseudomonas sp. AA-38]|uniref:hypothetical protein n=1 Tax=Pseudomonas sp. AA-38 TaxID=3028807 RepID=UPI0023F6F4FE|nr:hypothetical protein [Pseudomonas sp. AA-38]
MLSLQYSLARLQAPAQRMWLRDVDKLSREQVAIVAQWDFYVARALPSEPLDNTFTDWSGEARIIQLSIARPNTGQLDLPAVLPARAPLLLLRARQPSGQ